MKIIKISNYHYFSYITTFSFQFQKQRIETFCKNNPTNKLCARRHIWKSKQNAMKKIMSMDKTIQKLAKSVKVKDTETKPKTKIPTSQPSADDCQFSRTAEMVIFKSAMNLIAKQKATIQMTRESMQKLVKDLIFSSSPVMVCIKHLEVLRQ